MRWHVAIAAVAACLAAAPLSAKTIVVQMKDKGKDGAMVFEPGYVRAEPGDVIHFQPTNPLHNAETIAGMLPAGAAPLKGPLSKPVDFKVTVPGLYGIKCLPHYAMGMVALVQVGKAPANAAASKLPALPPFAKARMSKYLAQVR